MTGLYRTQALLVPWTVRNLHDLAGVLKDTAPASTAWHDGDTCNVIVDRGEDDLLLTHLRCGGYNAPEVYGDSKPAGEAAAAYVRTLADTGDLVTLDSSDFTSHHEEDDFGRMLANVTLPDGSSLARRMIAAGHAIAYPAEKTPSA